MKSLSNIDKSFFSISEASQIIGEDQHVLRFWESRFSQVKPIRKSGNRRYYRKEDINLLLNIKQLLRDRGLSIKGLQKLFKNNKSSSFNFDQELNISLIDKESDSLIPSSQISFSKEDIIKVINELKQINNIIYALKKDSSDI